MKAKKVLRKLLLLCLVLAVLGSAAVLAVNACVRSTGQRTILTPEEAAELQDVDCIIVLGCQVKANGVPSDMLKDRLERGIALYKDGAAPKLLMSGDHGRVEYNEVGAMKDYAMAAGIPSEDIFMDHAGFSTYETMYRAKEIFGARKVLIVTQEYHLYRAVYIAEKMGMEAYGVAADYHIYRGQAVRECREILARCKDFATTLWMPKPTYLGTPISIHGNGDQTND